jgi:hypothetical protein
MWDGRRVACNAASRHRHINLHDGDVLMEIFLQALQCMPCLCHTTVCAAASPARACRTVSYEPGFTGYVFEQDTWQLN